MADEKKIVEIRLDAEAALRMYNELIEANIKLEAAKKELKKTDDDYAKKLANVTLELAKNKKALREISNEILNEDKIRKQREAAIERQIAKEVAVEQKRMLAAEKAAQAAAKAAQDEEDAYVKALNEKIKAETAYQARQQAVINQSEQEFLKQQALAEKMLSSSIKQQAYETALIDKMIQKRSEANAKRQLEEARIDQMREKREAKEAQAALKQEGYLNQLQIEVRQLTEQYYALSEAEFKAAQAGEKGAGLDTINALKAKRKALAEANEAYGNFTHSVGNYGNATRGIAISMGQIANELPNFAISARIGIMSLSNNIPMLIDNIRALNAQNAELRRQGQPTASVFKTLASSIFSWQTLVAVGVSLFVAYGEKIWDWITTVKQAIQPVNLLGESVKVLNEAMKSGGGVYGDAVKKIQAVETAQRQFAKGYISDKEFLHVYNSELGDTIGKTNDVGVAVSNLAKKKDEYKAAMKEMAFANALFAESAKSAAKIIDIQTRSNAELLGENGYTQAIKEASENRMKIAKGEVVWVEELRNGVWVKDRLTYEKALQTENDLRKRYNGEANKIRRELVDSETKRMDFIESEAKKRSDNAFDIANKAGIDLINEQEQKSKKSKDLKKKEGEDAMAMIDYYAEIERNKIKQNALINAEAKDITDKKLLDLEQETLAKKLEILGLEPKKAEEIWGKMLDVRKSILDKMADYDKMSLTTLEEIIKTHSISIKDATEQMLPQLKDMMARIDEEKEMQYQAEYDRAQYYSELMTSFGQSTGELLGNITNGTEDLVRSSLKNVIMLALDALKAQTELAVAGVTIQGLASLNPAAMIIAAIKVAAIEAAFAGVKAIVSNAMSSKTSSSKSSSSSQSQSSTPDMTPRKYHTGGTSGYSADDAYRSQEITATLLKGERVLSLSQTKVFDNIVGSIKGMGGSSSITSGVAQSGSLIDYGMIAAAMKEAVKSIPPNVLSLKEFDLSKNRVDMMENITKISV